MDGLKFIGAGIAVLTGLGSGIGEGFICAKAMEGMCFNRNNRYLWFINCNSLLICKLRKEEICLF